MNDVIDMTFGPAFCGMRIIEDASLVDTVEDWSRVRSPSRARRRKRRGHRQNIRLIQIPKQDVYIINEASAVGAVGGRVMVLHPELVARLRHEMNAQMNQQAERIFRFGESGL